MFSLSIFSNADLRISVKFFLILPAPLSTLPHHFLPFHQHDITSDFTFIKECFLAIRRAPGNSTLLYIVPSSLLLSLTLTFYIITLPSHSETTTMTLNTCANVGRRLDYSFIYTSKAVFWKRDGDALVFSTADLLVIALRYPLSRIHFAQYH